MKYKKGDVLVTDLPNFAKEIEVLDAIDDSNLKIMIGDRETKITIESIELGNYHIVKKEIYKWEKLKQALDNMLDWEKLELHATDHLIHQTDFTEHPKEAHWYSDDIVVHSTNISAIKEILKFMEELEIWERE